MPPLDLVNMYWGSEVKSTNGATLPLRTAWLARMAHMNEVGTDLSTEGVTFHQPGVEGGPDGLVRMPHRDNPTYANHHLVNLEPRPAGLHANVDHTDASGAGPGHNYDDGTYHTQEEKSEREMSGHCDVSYPFNITTKAAYNGLYCAFMIIIPKPDINAQGQVMARPPRDRNFLFVPAQALINNRFMYDAAGRVCTCHGVLNAVHPSSVPGSGNVVVQASEIQRARVHPAFPALTLDARDPLGFAHGVMGAPVPYQAHVAVMTNRPNSRFAMEYFINIPGGPGQVLTALEIRAIFEDMVRALGL